METNLCSDVRIRKYFLLKQKFLYASSKNTFLERILSFILNAKYYCKVSLSIFIDTKKIIWFVENFMLKGKREGIEQYSLCWFVGIIFLEGCLYFLWKIGKYHKIYIDRSSHLLYRKHLNICGMVYAFAFFYRDQSPILWGCRKFSLQWRCSWCPR